MKHFLSRSKARIIVLALLLSFGTQAWSHYRRLNVYYTQSNLPGQCLFPASLPDICTPLVQSELCTITSGSVSITYYKTSSCITPYWKKP